MSVELGSFTRQWIALPSASCDMRIGEGLLEAAGSILKGAVGKPRLAALVLGTIVDESLAERIRRQLTDAGFDVGVVPFPSQQSVRQFSTAETLASTLAKLSVTSDDLIVAVGDADELSLCAFVAGAWLGGTTLAVVPTSIDAAVVGIVSPHGIDAGDKSDSFSIRGCARFALCDLSIMGYSDAKMSFTRARMATIAMCESERAFSALWDRALEISAGDIDALQLQLPATIKGLGQLLTSSSAAIRSSATYGESFARALTSLVPSLDQGVALAEGMRFCARLAAALGICSIDDVLVQDELLERLSLGFANCSFDGPALATAICAERFSRTNRLMLELPRSLGKVRLSSVSNELLLEHAQAWCAARVLG